MMHKSSLPNVFLICLMIGMDPGRFSCTDTQTFPLGSNAYLRRLRRQRHPLHRCSPRPLLCCRVEIPRLDWPTPNHVSARRLLPLIPLSDMLRTPLVVVYLLRILCLIRSSLVDLLCSPVWNLLCNVRLLAYNMGFVSPKFLLMPILLLAILLL